MGQLNGLVGHGALPVKRWRNQRSGLKVCSYDFPAVVPELTPPRIVPRILKGFWLSFVICFALIIMMIVFASPAVPYEWQIWGYQFALIIPLSLVVGCHILLPVRLYFRFGSVMCLSLIITAADCIKPVVDEVFVLSETWTLVSMGVLSYFKDLLLGSGHLRTFGDCSREIN